MSDQQEPTLADRLVDRLATRVGQLTAENEWLRLQLEMMQQDQEPQVNMNGDTPQEVVTP